jgi:GNAT superfamily N-acetyltransferase
MKDLGGVADLIERTFAPDLDSSGMGALRELRWLSHLQLVVWWMLYFSDDHSDFLSGFVWEEDGKIVGNVTVNRATTGARRWLISNLAVAEGYKGRGIGRSLMDASIELVNQYNGLSVSLQVRADNTPAKRLYHSLGFKEIGGSAYLRLERVPRVYNPPRLPRELTLRSRQFNLQDDRLAYDLAIAATPAATQREWPVYRHQFQLGGEERLDNFLRVLIGGGAVAHWVIEDNRRLVGLIDVKPGLWGQTHYLRLLVHPDWRGHLEKLLIGRALNYLYPWRNRAIILRHPADHVEAIEAYKEFGFQEQQTLLWMKREI